MSGKKSTPSDVIREEVVEETTGASEVTQTTAQLDSQKMRFTVDQLFQSKRFKNNYQYDFAKQILGDKVYTPTEAEIILDKYFKKGAN